jgi:hypothetical protein
LKDTTLHISPIYSYSNSSPTNQSQFDEWKSAAALVTQSWIDSSTPPGIIAHVGTKEVVEDYENVRKALGYEKINFLGAS